MSTNPEVEVFKSGFIAVAGRPNVGKSTLMNVLLGQKVAIVSPKPQTTRRRQLGIHTTDEAQIIFVDTPGIHRPRHSLDEYMLATATHALEDADAILWVVDVTQPPGAGDRHIGRLLAERAGETPVVLALNKSDKLPPKKVLPHTDAYRALAPAATWMLTSATRGDNLDKLLARLVEALPAGPQYYPPDQITDTQIRDLSVELIREAALHYLQDEVPHGVAVEIDEFDESSDVITRILATVYVERESHKGIIIGKGGRMLRQIGSHARREIMNLLDTRVYLELHVKVRAGWRADEREVRRLGYRSDG